MTLDTELKVEHLPLRPIATIGPDETLACAARTMRTHDVSSLVVNEPTKPVAIITERDLTRALADAAGPDTPLAAVASAHPVTIPVDATAIEAASRMLHHDIRHLVVTQDNRAIGILSIRDLLQALVQSHTPQVVYAFVHQAFPSEPTGAQP